MAGMEEKLPDSEDVIGALEEANTLTGKGRLIGTPVRLFSPPLIYCSVVKTAKNRVHQPLIHQPFYHMRLNSNQLAFDGLIYGSIWTGIFAPPYEATKRLERNEP